MTKGRDIFSPGEAVWIRAQLARIRNADGDDQKRLRGELRRHGFFITDFTGSSAGFTPEDFDRLIAIGRVRIR